MSKDKPIFETESFRVWETEKDKEKIKDLTKNDIKVKYKDMEIGLTGFNRVIVKDKLIFAYKIKVDDGSIMLLYYIPDDIFSEEKSKIINLINEIKDNHKIVLGRDIEIMDVIDTLENIYQQKYMFDKLDKIPNYKKRKGVKK